MAAHAQVLAALGRSRTAGALGPAPLASQLDHALAYAEVVGEAPARALDLGAGGGIPGLPLAAIAWPQCQMTLLDGNLRRCRLLEALVEELELEPRVSVVHGRAEDVARAPGHRERYEVVVARSFGPPAVVAECATGLLRQGGALVVSEPPHADPTLRWPQAGLEPLGFSCTAVGATGAHFVRLVREARGADPRWPRRSGVPERRPLF